VHMVSPLYASEALLPQGAPNHWQRPYINAAVKISTDLTPQALIKALKHIEADIGRQQSARWSPRVVDIDLLAWGQHHQATADLTIPHPALLSRPFALWPLLDLAPDWVVPTPGPDQGKLAACFAKDWGDPHTGLNAPLKTQRIPHRIDTPILVGICNITPDSFSDGNATRSIDESITHAMTMAQQGAEIIDIGAESTRPGAAPLSAAQEWQRLAPVLDALKNHDGHTTAWQPQISIDSYHAQTIERCIAWGADWINDVSGRWASHFLPQHPTLKWVLMRPKSQPLQGTGLDCVQSCLHWAQTQYTALRALGVSDHQFVFDPGIGFGCDSHQSYALLNHLDLLASQSVPLYIGHSRKSFLASYSTAAAAERDPETLAVSLHCATHGVAYLRVHQVAWHARAFAIQQHFSPISHHQTTHHGADSS
jgi:2-amino-4-hydroxy-6-hydroxymethyldihydropteridine diphosphokinase / dihydropteroate synthase